VDSCAYILILEIFLKFIEILFSLFLIFRSKATGRRRHWVICHSSKDTHWIQVNI
jgi:hypothetical protein